ncbi:MAG: response regulator [Nitrospirae bacterium]|nr:response regulator [Nitrospirota bacterium]MBF0535058.1 response regulator [Nitrospirota bacterium]MBF0616566.1 response regulator [Nitrospirota bacterium]
MKQSSLVRKTLVSVITLFAVITVTTSLFSIRTISDYLTDEYVSKGKAIAEGIANSTAEIILNRDASTVQALIDQYSATEGVAYVYVTDENGAMLSHTFVPRVPADLGDRKGDRESTAIRYQKMKKYGDIIDVSAPILFGVAGYTHIGMSRDVIKGHVFLAIRKSIVFMSLIFVFSTAAILIMAKRISRPLKILTRYAREVAADNIYVPEDIRKEVMDISSGAGNIGEEIRVLAEALSSMTQRLTENIKDLDKKVWERTSELEDTLVKLKALDEMKSSFLSTVSHELRTPLTSVLGFADIIRKQLDQDLLPLITVTDKKTERSIKRVREHIDIITTESRRLTTLINDVLDISKMEAGKVEWRTEPLNFQEIITRAVSATSVLFKNKGVEVVCDVQTDLPVAVGDRDRFIQVLINLLSNAAKFSDKGTVTCSAQRQGDDIVVGVQDEGLGIAREDCGKVFDKFKQVGDTLTDRPAGTGLGLSICKQIVEHHGGYISVDSVPGKGSRFSFTVPTDGPKPKTMDMELLVRHLDEYEVRGEAAPDARCKNILVVDDQAHIRSLLKYELEAAGYNVREAADGIEAVNDARENRPDLIILDIMMPVMNGIDAAAVLKSNPATGDIPIIVLSILEDENKGYRVGVDRYLKKPINVPALLSEVQSLLLRNKSSKKVLIIDENESAIKSLSRMLEARGYTVIGAHDMSECLGLALSVRPNLIIIDISTSNKNDLLKSIKLEKSLETVTCILVGGETGVNS